MKPLSDTAMSALITLATDDRYIVTTLRNGDDDDWFACLRRGSDPAERTLPIQVFRKLRREGYLAKECEGQVTEPTDGRAALIHSDYVLTDLGRAAVLA